MRRIIILGSTGSIGTQALDVIRANRDRFEIVGLGVGLVVACLAAGAIGAYEVPPLEVVGSVLHRLGLEVGPVPVDVGESVLWDIRFPRVALALLVGAAHAAAPIDPAKARAATAVPANNFLVR